MKTTLRRSVLRIATAEATAAVLALGFASPAAAAGTVDQQVPNDGSSPAQSNWLWNQQMAQTFKEIRTGSLDRVALFEGSAGTPQFTLQIWQVDTSQSTLAATDTRASYTFLSVSGTPYWHYFDLNPAFHVNGGVEYAIVIRAIRPFTVKWSYVSGYQFDGGQWTCCDLQNKWVAGVAGTDFAFATYVTGGTAPNSLPTLTASQGAVQAKEGTVPANSGTYGDSDGDTVHVTATAGTLTQIGTTSGTWSWTQAASDEAPTETVTVTADDGHNPPVTTQFTVDVVAVAPTVTVAPVTKAAALTATSGPAEGTSLSFSGSATAAWSGDQSSVTYSWSVTKDGSPFGASGTGTSFSFTPNDEGAYVVTLSAADDSSLPATTGEASVTVLDVKPTAIIGSVVPSQTTPRIIVANESIAFSGSFTDPGTADPHTASWDFGDKTPAVSGWTPAHSYAAAGTYTVTLTVAQGEDSGVGTATYTLTVQSPAQALGTLATYVRGLSGLDKGLRNSLAAKLDAASASAARGDDKTANNQLDAFLNEVRADEKTGKLTPAQAAILTDAVHTIKGALGTYNRFLEWWPLSL